MSLFTRLFKNLSTQRTSRFGNEEPMTFKERMEALRNVPPFLRIIWQTHPGYALTNLILRLLQAGIPVTTLYIGKLIIDEVIGLANNSIAEPDNLWLYVGLELGLGLFSALLSRGISLTDALLGDLVSNETSVRIMEHAAAMDLPQFEDANFYDKLERARRQTTGRTRLMSDLLQQGQNTISMIFLGAGLVVFNPWLILLLIVAVIPAFISENHFNQRSYSLARNWTPERRELDYFRFIGASDQTAKEVKIFGLEGFVKDRFAHLAHTYYLANRGLAVKRAGFGFLFNSLGTIGYYAAYVVIILQAISGSITIGDLTFLSGSFNRLRNMLQNLLSRFASIAQSALYLKDLFDFLAIKPEITNVKEPLPFPETIKEGFTFEKVSFKYPNTEIYAIRDLSFTLRAGEKLALVGENGAGKTTLVKLLARLYDPNEGRILLDGVDLREYDLHGLREAVGVIFQDYVRFSFTAGENIAVGRIEEREDQPQIEEAAHLSLADQVIDGLAGGYDQ
ncbi:MAG: ABC transporter ATP-binding protein, partial [Bacteroidota bacterium]